MFHWWWAQILESPTRAHQFNCSFLILTCSWPDFSSLYSMTLTPLAVSFSGFENETEVCEKHFLYIDFYSLLAMDT